MFVKCTGNQGRNREEKNRGVCSRTQHTSQNLRCSLPFTLQRPRGQTRLPLRENVRREIKSVKQVLSLISLFKRRRISQYVYACPSLHVTC